MNWKCFFGLHLWRKWSRPVPLYSGERSQWRECSVCGQAQCRRIWFAFQADTRLVAEELERVKAQEMEAPDA
jgi:hypothetical protein